MHIYLKSELLFKPTLLNMFACWPREAKVRSLLILCCQKNFPPSDSASMDCFISSTTIWPFWHFKEAFRCTALFIQVGGGETTKRWTTIITLGKILLNSNLWTASLNRCKTLIFPTQKSGDRCTLVVVCWEERSCQSFYDWHRCTHQNYYARFSCSYVGFCCLYRDARHTLVE